jgi:hypothetical protein
MRDLPAELRDLRTRLRLQMLVMIGAITVGLFALGGADVVARVFVETPAWRVKTKKADLVNYTDRIIATTDVDKAQVQINDANLVMTGLSAATTGNVVLAQQTTAQLPSGAAPGTIAYDSSVNTLKYYNGTSWVAPSASASAKCVLSWGATLNGFPNSLCRWSDPGQNNLAVMGSLTATIAVPCSGTLRNMRFRLSGSPGLGGVSWTATVWVTPAAGGSATNSLITATISDPNSVSTDSVHSFAVNAYDNIEIRITAGGNPIIRLATVDLEFDAN